MVTALKKIKKYNKKIFKICIFPLIVGIANIPTNVLNATVCNKMN